MLEQYDPTPRHDKLLVARATTLIRLIILRVFLPVSTFLPVRKKREEEDEETRELSR